jgi:protoporphyrinogen oxidase
METEFLIAGAGLAGLSAGYHLAGRDHTILEAENAVGGLCKTYRVDGFHFDCTGHLIHFRTETGKELLMKLVGNQIERHERKAAIFLQNRYTDYPFQANTYGLPPEVIRECLLGFIQTLTTKRSSHVQNFHDWIYDTFGSGIARYFMIPYNEKLWQHDLHDVDLDWVNWSIPKPNLEDVINGALGIKNRQFGYNPVFFYPKQGGINLLPNSFAASEKVLLNSPVAKIHMKKRKATLRDGRTIRYRTLLSTMPLHQLLGYLEDASVTLNASRDKLRYVSVLNINLGIERENVLPYHWVYFPEPKIPFYRVGSPSNFSHGVAPKGTSSLFVEVSLKPDTNPDVDDLVKQTIQALVRCKILRDNDKIVSVYPILLQYAYVIYDSNRRKVVESIQRTLGKRDIHTFGRYGSWIYSSMEDAILQGKAIAESLTLQKSNSRA